jgi:hypothetical protein
MDLAVRRFTGVLSIFLNHHVDNIKIDVQKIKIALEKFKGEVELAREGSGGAPCADGARSRRQLPRVRVVVLA